MFTNYIFKQIIIHGRQFEFTEVKVVNLGVEHYDYNTGCGNNNVWHDSDHASLPARVVKMEGADLLLALFIRLWFFSNIYYDLFKNQFNQFEVNYSIIFVLRTWVNMTKKCMDDRLRVWFLWHPKAAKLHSLLLAAFCLIQNTYLFVK